MTEFWAARLLRTGVLLSALAAVQPALARPPRDHSAVAPAPVRPEFAAAEAGLPPCDTAPPDPLYSYPATPLAVVTPAESPRALVAADFDGDGQADLALLGTGGRITIYRHGPAGLESWGQAVAPTGADRFFAQDVDGDGRLDFVATNPTARTIGFARGHGDGTFQARFEYVMPKEISGVAVIDVDGDGRDDLVVGSRGKELGAIDWFPGGGAHGFIMAGTRLHDYGVTSLSRLDVTGDGRPDLVAATEDTCCDASARLLTFAGRVGNRLAEPVVSRLSSRASLAQPAFGDFDGDGRIDIFPWAVSGAVYFGSGDGGFHTDNRVVSTLGVDAVAADLDGDGRSDLLGRVGGNGSALGIVYARGSGLDPGAVAELYLRENILAELALDWDHDRWLDLALVLQGGRVVVLAGDPRRAWNGPFLSGGVYEARDLLVADFNGDGRNDVCLALIFTGGDPRQPASTGVRVFPARADGSLGPSIYTGGYGSSILAVGDVDGDGTIDLLLPRSNGFNRAPGLGDGRFGALVAQGLPFTPRWLGLSDVDEDGRLDVVAGGGTSLVIRLQQPDQTFADGPTLSDGAPNARFVLGDLDGDGHVDIVAVHETATEHRLVTFLGAGDGSFSTGPAVDTGQGALDLVLSDFDLDGRVEVVSADVTDGTLSIRTYLPGGQFGPRTVLSAGGTPQGLAAGDVNGDGRPDLVSSNHVVVYLSRCDGSFSAAAPEPYTESTVGQVALADFANDGHPALVGRQQFWSHAYPHRGPASVTPCADLLSRGTRRVAEGTRIEWRVRGYATGDRFRVFRLGVAGDTTKLAPGYFSGAVSYSLLDPSPGSSKGYLLEMAGSNGRIERIPLASDGAATPLVASLSAVRHEAQVAIHWTLSRDAPGTTFRLFRRVSPGPFEPVGSASYSGGRTFDAVDPLPSPEATDYWLFVSGADGGVGYVGPASVGAFGEPPPELALRALSGNPVHGLVRLEFETTSLSPLSLRIYDATGRRIRTLSDGYASAGIHRLDWAGEDESGGLTPSGLYFVRLDVPEGGRVLRVVRLR